MYLFLSACLAEKDPWIFKQVLFQLAMLIETIIPDLGWSRNPLHSQAPPVWFPEGPTVARAFDLR